MNGRGALQVSPDELLAAATAFAPARQMPGHGATRAVHAIAEAMGAPEAGSDFSRRLTAATDLLEDLRRDLRRGLGSAASAYASSDAHIAHEMRTGS